MLFAGRFERRGTKELPMKKTTRRLVLAKETLRSLEEGQLPAGGTTGSESCCMTTIACFQDTDCNCTWMGC
jgi:hypothetical protein